MAVDFGNYRPETLGWEMTHGNNAPYSYHGIEIAGGLNPYPGYQTLVTRMLDALVPAIPGGLVAGWCWGGDTTDSCPDSFHLYGLAIDLNAPVNPRTTQIQPWGAQHVLPANTGDLVRLFGFEWGGSWTADTPPDYMHIEFQGTPSDVAQILAEHNSSAPAAPPPPPAAGGPACGPFPLPAGYYFGPLSGPVESISGMSSTEGAQLSAHRSAIGHIQTAINAISLHWPQAPAQLRVDGEYGPATQGAAAWFQASHALLVDGLVGPDSWAKLGL